MKFFRQIFDEGDLPATVIAKWPLSVVDEGFVPFPKRLLRAAPSIFAGQNGVRDLVVALAVVDYRKAHRSPPPSEDYLAFLAGMEIAEFRAGLSSLVEAGFAKVATAGEDRISVDLSGLNQAIEQQTAEPDRTSG